MAIISVPYRWKGGPSPTNVYHLYEPGEGELVESLEEHFQEVKVRYQYFEETVLMKAARLFHFRKLVGLQEIYRALAQGEPHATSRLKIGRQPVGLKMHVVVMVERPKP